MSEVKAIETFIGKPVRIAYQTINLGNGSPDEQESGTLTGTFNGTFSTTGRTLRFEFDPDLNAPRRYFFIDEILTITPVAANAGNGEIQANRINEDGTLIGGIYAAIKVYMEGQGTDIEGAVRDALVEVRHICDAKGLDYGALDKRAYLGYVEELRWREEETTTEVSEPESEPETGNTCPKCGGHSFDLEATFNGTVSVTFTPDGDEDFTVDDSEPGDSEWSGPAECCDCGWAGTLADLVTADEADEDDEDVTVMVTVSIPVSLSYDPGLRPDLATVKAHALDVFLDHPALKDAKELKNFVDDVEVTP